MSGAPYIFLDDQITGQSRYYEAPLSLIEAHNQDEVSSALASIETALASGKYVAGYASYELGLQIGKPLDGHSGRAEHPILQFGVFDHYDPNTRPFGQSYAPLPELKPQWSEEQYLERFERVKTYIEAGDIYQINLTFPYSGTSDERPDFAALYGHLRGRQPVRYGGIIKLCDRHILSLSPELFFEIEGRTVRTRPMKGTAPRGATPIEDRRIGKAMQKDEKSQAENLMIVDLLRNDLSMIGQSGTTKVTDLFSLETYPTLHQMTSGIETTVRAGVTATEVFSSLFPCGSITGAPKRRAMEIIEELEPQARGPYCGAIGYFDPDGDTKFNVAIRTLTSQPSQAGFVTRYGVGSGVVYDSDGAQEYAECKLKSAIVTAKPNLIETLKWTPKDGFMRLELHASRLLKNAREFEYSIDLNILFSLLDAEVVNNTTPKRIRISLSKAGQIVIQSETLSPFSSPVKLAISKNILTSQKQIYRAKVDARTFYDGERSRLKLLTSCDEVLFLNTKDQLCEGSFTSLFLKLPDTERLQTPTLKCGLLPGVLRHELIATGQAEESILSISDMARAEQLYVGNSLRGLMPAILLSLDLK